MFAFPGGYCVNPRVEMYLRGSCSCVEFVSCEEQDVSASKYEDV